MDEIGVFFCHELAQIFTNYFCGILLNLCEAKGMRGGIRGWGGGGGRFGGGEACRR